MLMKGGERWVVPLAALVLCSCSLGPRYVRRDLPAPASWALAGKGASALTGEQTASAAWPSADWWRGFNSPQLDELMSQARGANDDIGAAMARVSEAEAQARIAGAALLPSVAASADGGRERQSSKSTGPLAYGTSNTFGTTLAASYQIDLWGRYRATRDAARQAAAASRYDRVTVELTVLTSVATTYFQTLAARDRLTVAQSNLARAQVVLEGMQLEQQVGTITALEVAQQAAVVANLQTAVPPLNQELGQGTDAMAILIGKLPQDVQLGTGSLSDLAQPRVNPGLPSQLLARRPDVASAEAQLMAANANIAAARAAFFPSISLTGDGGFASATLGTLVGPAARIFALTGNVTQPIFQGRVLSGQYQYDRARYSELLAVYHRTVITAFANVEDALIDVRQATEREQRQQDATDSARSAYELSQAQWHAGIIDILTVLNTETALFTAEDALVQVKFSHLQALITLFSALGGGWNEA